MSASAMIEISDDKSGGVVNKRRVGSRGQVNSGSQSNYRSVDSIFPDFNWHILEQSKRKETRWKEQRANSTSSRTHNSNSSVSGKAERSERQAANERSTGSEQRLRTQTGDVRKPASSDSSDIDERDFFEECSDTPDEASVPTNAAKAKSSKQSSHSVNHKSAETTRLKSSSAISTERSKHVLSNSVSGRNVAKSNSSVNNTVELAERWLRGRLATLVQEAVANAKESVAAEARELQLSSTRSLQEQLDSLKSNLASQRRQWRAENAALLRRAELAESKLAASDVPKHSVSTQTSRKSHHHQTVATQTVSPQKSSESKTTVELAKSCGKRCAESTEGECDATKRVRLSREDTNRGFHSPLSSPEAKSSKSSPLSISSSPSVTLSPQSLPYNDCDATVALSSPVTTSAAKCDSRKQPIDSDSNSTSSSAGCNTHSCSRKRAHRAEECTSPQALPLSQHESSWIASKSTRFRLKRIEYNLFNKYNGPRHPLSGLPSEIPAPTFTRLELVECQLRYQFEYSVIALEKHRISKFRVSVADSFRREWKNFAVALEGAESGKILKSEHGNGLVRLFCGTVDLSDRLANAELYLFLYVSAFNSMAQFSRLSMPIGACVYQRASNLS